jgi:DNA-binding NarL/FixJ family response regulator
MECKAVPDLGRALRSVRDSNGETQNRRFGLTACELQIVAAILSGCTNKDIAENLVLSEQTLKHHLVNIFDKLGVSSRLELALHAAQHRLVDVA